MKLLADLHTHSNYSRFGHGKNKIEEMAIAANEIGLVEIGITDHGYAHFFRTNKANIKQARKIINEINSWSRTKVLLGVEADILNENGDIDIDTETLSMLDILIVGYHKMISTDFAGFFGHVKNTPEAKRKCTNAFVNAIKRFPVTIVAHLDSILDTDLYEIGKICAQRGTMVEINNRHTKWTGKQVEDLIASGCMFVLSSDAHSRADVGKVDRAMEFVTKYDIPSERVANVEFAVEEMSEEDRQYSAYKSVYEQLAKKKATEENNIEKREKTEITGKLSKEMEEELEKIARERGEAYSSYKRPQASSGYLRDINEQNERLIAQAEEYINQNSMKNFADENDNIGSYDGDSALEGYRFNEDHPLLRNAENFEERYQPLGSVVEKDSVQAPRVEQKSEYQQLSSTSINTNNNQELKKMLAPEPQQPAPKPEPKVERPVFEKPSPEEFMDSITQTRLVDNTKLKSQTPKPAVKKPVQQKTSRKGAFIVVDNLIDGEGK